jgi:stringent starvation protein B
MKSKKPYLLRAYYDWISDNQLTPYLLVNATYPQVTVPTQYVRDGKIVLDISAAACRGLDISSANVQFSARFAGQLMQIHLPLGSIQAIYAKENSEGMTFQPEDFDVIEPQVENNNNIKKPFLSIVRKNDPQKS